MYGSCRQDERVVPCGKAGNKPESYAHIGRIEPIGLAGQADVPVRTIQQYEQRQKDINKAQAETLLRLARALNCNVEDLMEKVPPLNFK